MGRRMRATAGAAYGVLALTETALTADHRARPRARLVTKPLLMPALALRFVSGPHRVGHNGVVAAQCFAWGGDVALLGGSRRAFLTGLGSFLTAHVACIAAYRRRSSAPVLATPGRRRFLAAGAVAASGMALAAGREDRTVVVPVAAYGVALTSMVVTAAAIDRDRGRNQVLAGAVLFFVSDTMIGVRAFLAGDRVPGLDAAVMATYTAGQWLISEGMTGA
ncbi:MAG: lysoplasmalogenase [Nocardioides sp.]